MSSSNFKVCVRIRPRFGDECEEEKVTVEALDAQMLVFDPQGDNRPSFARRSMRRNPQVLQRRARDLKFAFDQVFDESATQKDVFEQTAKPIIDGVLDGYNSSVFCYGATGAGKTHTMLGHGKEPGVIILAVEELFKRIKERQDDISCNVAVSYLEVYNEKIRDLLAPEKGVLNLREGGEGVVVSGLTVQEPEGPLQLLSLLEKGNENRTQHPTDANATSSRSHAVFTVHVHQTPKGAGINANVSVAKLTLIDLAGSERATATHNRGMRMREGANINKSLLALGNCINALASGKKRMSHIPYRDSKLTRILKDSLGGNCRTVMIANCSPSLKSYEDTHNTLNYANRAKNIKVDLKKNVVNVDFHVTKYKKIVQSLQGEVTALRQKLRKTQQSLEASQKQQKAPPKLEQKVDKKAVSKGIKTMKPMFIMRKKLIKNVITAEASVRAREADIRQMRRDLKRAEWLKYNDIHTTSEHIEKANAGIINAETEKLKADADLSVFREKLQQNNEQNVDWQKNAEEEFGDSIELQIMKYNYECHALQCENIGLKLRAETLRRDLRHEYKESRRTVRVVDTLMKVCARMKQHLETAESQNEESAELIQMAEGALNLVISGKEVIWSDRESLDGQRNKSLFINTPPKMHTPTKSLTARHTPMRSVNKTYLQKASSGRNDGMTAPTEAKNMGSDAPIASLKPKVSDTMTVSVSNADPHDVMSADVGAQNDAKTPTEAESSELQGQPALRAEEEEAEDASKQSPDINTTVDCHQATLPHMATADRRSILLSPIMLRQGSPSRKEALPSPSAAAKTPEGKASKKGDTTFTALSTPEKWATPKRALQDLFVEGRDEETRQSREELFQMRASRPSAANNVTVVVQSASGREEADQTETAPVQLGEPPVSAEEKEEGRLLMEKSAPASLGNVLSEINQFLSANITSTLKDPTSLEEEMKASAGSTTRPEKSLGSSLTSPGEQENAVGSTGHVNNQTVVIAATASKTSEHLAAGNGDTKAKTRLSLDETYQLSTGKARHANKRGDSEPHIPKQTTKKASSATLSSTSTPLLRGNASGPATFNFLKPRVATKKKKQPQHGGARRRCAKPKPVESAEAQLSSSLTSSGLSSTKGATTTPKTATATATAKATATSAKGVKTAGMRPGSCTTGATKSRVSSATEPAAAKHGDKKRGTLRKEGRALALRNGAAIHPKRFMF